MAHEHLGTPGYAPHPSFVPYLEAPRFHAAHAPPPDYATPGDAEQRYVFVRSAPALASDELEEVGRAALEITVLWGETVLHVAHLSPPRPFSVGHGAAARVDFVVPAELAPFARAEIVAVHAGVPHAVAPHGAELAVHGGRIDASSADASGVRSAVLVDGAVAEVVFGSLKFRVASTTPGKRVPRHVGADTAGLGSSFLATVAAVGTFLGTLAYYTPALGSTLDDGLDRDKLAVMLALLNADAERENKARPSEGESSNERGGGTPGTAAKGPEGKMGRPDKPSVQKRFAIAGSGEVVLSRPALIADAMNFGTVGLLNAMNSRAVPQALWGADVPNGPDATDAWGEMFGESIDESGGAGGLGLSGPGSGGGGYGEQIGLGSIGTCGTNCGVGPGGFGTGVGRGGRKDHEPTGPRLRAGVTTVNGHIPAEVIQRIVRQNYGRFRQCYETGLRTNPNLTGRVSARFVIGRDGAVSNVSNGGGDLPDASVTSCVLAAFYGLSFPTPDGGIVTVTYPIMLVPG
jgi:hypothetical protein